MDDFIEGNDLKRDVAILKKWKCHFGQFKILVIVDDPGKPFLSEMLQQSIDDTFGFSAPCRGHHGNAPTDVPEDQCPSPHLQPCLKDLGRFIGIPIMIHQTKNHDVHKKQRKP